MAKTTLAMASLVALTCAAVWSPDRARATGKVRSLVVILLAIAACGGQAANSGADAGVDAYLPKTDASPEAASDAPTEAASGASGIATFSFVVNGNVQTPMACSFADWEFAPVSGQTRDIPGSCGSTHGVS